MAHKFNQSATVAFFNATVDPAVHCMELRVFGASFDRNNWIRPTETYKKTLAGWFDDGHALAAEAFRLDGVSGYVTVNPVSRDLLARSHNKLIKIGKDEGTQDTKIACIGFLYVDIDPKRDKGVSATDAELKKAFDLRDAILEKFPEFIPSVQFGMSGNGVWMRIRLDSLANNEKTHDLVVRFNRSMRAHFKDHDGVEIDAHTINASRVMCLPGTMKCKGSDMADRPHRMVTIDSPIEDLNKVIPFPLGDWLGKNEIEVTIRPPKAAPVVVAPGAPLGGADLDRRINDWMRRKEPAISGQGGHKKAFDVAMDLIQGWALSPSEARPYFDAWNLTCQPPWSDSEINHKLDEADKAIDSQGRQRGWIKEANRNGFMIHKSYGHDFIFPAPLSFADGKATQAEPEERLQIVIRPDIAGMIDEAEVAISRHPLVYQRANQLVTTIRDTVYPRGTDPKRTTFAIPRIITLEAPSVREICGRSADWVTLKPVKDSDDMQAVPAMPPELVAPTIIARSDWPNVRPLRMVIESPVIRPDGTILDKPGYDPSTALLFSPNVAFDPIPENPTKADAMEAMGRILELVEQFPFVGDNHRAAWLAAFLTPFARFAIDAPCPLFLFDANKPGSGKTKLVDVIASVVSGNTMPRSIFPKEEDEIRKRITSIALAASRFAFIDNIPRNTQFGGAALDAALTGADWDDRILGASKMTGPIPLYSIWYATGNNVHIKGDIGRRIVFSRLRVDVERAEERSGFTKTPLEGWAKENRPWLIRDALLILRAFHLAGRPRSPVPPPDYPQWWFWIQACVYWLTGADCWSTHDELRQQDAEQCTTYSVIEGWREIHEQSEGKGITAARALEILNLYPSDYVQLREALMEWSNTSALPTPRQVGSRLKQMKDQVFGEWRLRGVSYKGTFYWSVRPVNFREPNNPDSHEEDGLRGGTVWLDPPVPPHTGNGDGDIEWKFD